jgi:putative transposase
MVSEHHLSERRACRLVGLSRDSYRHPPQADQATVELHEKIVEIAHVRRRFGYRRIHDLLRPEFPGVNHKRVYRLYGEANLAVRKRKKGKRPVNERVPLQLARTVNEVWSMDFVSDSLQRPAPEVPDGGRRLQPRERGHRGGLRHLGQYVTRVLDRAALFRGYPQAVRTDNGPEFTSRAFMAWAHSHGIRHILIEPGRPCRTATSRASTASSATSA